MGNIPVAFCVLGALLTLYVVAAAWRSRDASPRVRSNAWHPQSRPLSVDRRLDHWRRAREHFKKLN